MTDHADLTAKTKALGQPFLAQREAARSHAVEAAAQVNRLVLAEALLAADLPEDAVVDVTDWAEEPNGDGTYDMDIAEAYLPNGDSLGDLGGQGAISAGRVDGGTDWDLFLLNADDPATLSVAKVYDWLRNQTA